MQTPSSPGRQIFDYSIDSLPESQGVVPPPPPPSMPNNEDSPFKRDLDNGQYYQNYQSSCLQRQQQQQQQQADFFYENDAEDDNNSQNIQDSMIMMNEGQERKNTISDSPVKASNKQSRQSCIDSSVPNQNQHELIESREIQFQKDGQVLDNKYQFRKFSASPKRDKQLMSTTPKKQNKKNSKHRSSNSPIERLMHSHMRKKQAQKFSPIKSAYSPQKERELQQSKKQQKRMQMSRLIQHIGTELKRVQQTLSPSIRQKLDVTQSLFKKSSSSPTKHIKLTKSISISPTPNSGKQKSPKSPNFASPSTNITFSANGPSPSSSLSSTRKQIQTRPKGEVTKFSLNNKKKSSVRKSFDNLSKISNQQDQKTKKVSNLLLRSVPSAKYGEGIALTTNSNKRSSQNSPAFDISQSAKVSPRDTILDLLDDQHQILQKFYQVKGLKKSTVAAATLQQKGSRNSSPPKQIFRGVKGDCVGKKLQQSTAIDSTTALRFSINHIRQSDSYFQGLNEHLDNQLRGIAVLITQKKELEQQNQKFLASIKAINNDINQNYVALHNVNRELNYTLQRQAQLKEDILRLKNFVKHLRGQNQRRKEQEYKNLSELKQKFDKCQKNVFDLSKEREENSSSARLSQSERYNQIKRLSFRNEESAKLLLQLNTKSAYQKKIQDTRTNMLREKGRLLSQLINKEEIHKDETSKVKVSREVMKDLSKILSVISTKKKA